MLPTVIVGLIFAAIVGYGVYRSVIGMKNNSCPGCSGTCTEQEKKTCHE